MRHFTFLVFAVILTVQMCFSQTQIINDSLLNPFFAKLYHIKDSTKKVRVLQIGDSHIQGDTLPKATSNLLQKEFGNAGYCPIKGYNSIKPCNEVDTIGIVYTRIGKDGATASDYLKSDSFLKQISSINPDIVIISLGTNDAANQSTNQISPENNINLANNVKKIFNDSVPILLTSPPYEIGGTEEIRNFIKHKVSLYVAKLEEKISGMFAYLNLYNISKENYYENNKIMSRDSVHYKPAGYKIIGEYLATELLNAYAMYQPPKVEVLSTESSSSFENIISSSSSEITQSSSSNYVPPFYILKSHCNKQYYIRDYAGYRNKNKCFEMIQ